MFNPGLTLTGFRTTRPRVSGFIYRIDFLPEAREGWLSPRNTQWLLLLFDSKKPERENQELLFTEARWLTTKTDEETSSRNLHHPCNWTAPVKKRKIQMTGWKCSIHLNAVYGPTPYPVQPKVSFRVRLDGQGHALLRCPNSRVRDTQPLSIHVYTSLNPGEKTCCWH